MRYIKLIALALVPLAIGCWIFVILFSDFIESIAEEQFRGVFPGQATFAIEEPGAYHVWLHTRAFLDGELYATNTLPAGTTVTVQHDSQRLNLQTSGMSATKTLQNDEAVSIAKFDAHQPGNYTLAASGSGGPYVLSVSQFEFGGMFGSMIGAMGALLLGLAAAAFILVYGIVKGKKRHLPPPTPGQQPPSNRVVE